MSRRSDIATQCRELKLQVLFVDLGKVWRRDAQLWRELFLDNRTDIVLLAHHPDTDLVVRALRAGVYEVIDLNHGLFAHAIAKALFNSMVERHPKHEHELHIREFGEASVALRSRRVLLSRTESQVLSILAHSKGRCVPSSAITEGIWGGTAVNHKEDIYVYISRLREKLEKEPAQPELIMSSRGLGYFFKGELASHVVLV